MDSDTARRLKVAAKFDDYAKLFAQAYEVMRSYAHFVDSHRDLAEDPEMVAVMEGLTLAIARAKGAARRIYDQIPSDVVAALAKEVGLSMPD